MRISDWSSDVCSSDLLSGLRQPESETGEQQDQHDQQQPCRAGDRGMVPGQSRDLAGPGHHCAVTDRIERPDRQQRLDRKSVVSGKSVSVRVDLGGRRIIKQKNKKIKNRKNKKK